MGHISRLTKNKVPSQAVALSKTLVGVSFKDGLILNRNEKKCGAFARLEDRVLPDSLSISFKY